MTAAEILTIPGSPSLYVNVATLAPQAASVQVQLDQNAHLERNAEFAPGVAPGGGLPVNTNGGGLSYCHPGMYGLFLLIEAARQLRGECGARQVADCETAIAHGNGGVLSSQSTIILGTQATI